MKVEMKGGGRKKTEENGKERNGMEAGTRGSRWKRRKMGRKRIGGKGD